MKPVRSRVLSLLSLSCAALLAAQAANAASHNPHEVYAEAGMFGGVGAGYAYSFNDIFGVRAEVTAGNARYRFNLGQFRYDTRLKANQVGGYADWFPFGGKFHLTAGLHSRNLGLNAELHAKQEREISIGQVHVEYGGAEDWINAHVKWPTFAPYLGLGFGHSTSQRAGFGLIADLGVTIGSPSVQLSISDELRKKVDAATKLPGMGMGASADVEIEHQRRKLAQDLGKFKLFPHIYLGLAYRF